MSAGSEISIKRRGEFGSSHDSARLAILRLIQRKGQATVKELEQELGRTTTAVREQLTSLQAEGYVAAARVKVKGELGRPYFVYALTDKAQELFPKEYGDLTNLLMEEILELDGQEKLNLLLQRISVRVAARYAANIGNGQHLLDRLSNLVAFLSDKGMPIEVQQQGSVTTIHAPSCPYFAVAQRHREICDMEQQMLGQALGSPVRLTSCVLDGHHGCNFTVGENIELTRKPAQPIDLRNDPAHQQFSVINKGVFAIMFDGDLVIEDLHVSVEGKEILRGINLTIKKGEVHALMGPNGSGKSTLAYALAGHPKYTITQGRVTYKGEDLLALSADKRARLGLFLAFQYPSAVPGVSVANFLRSAVRAKVKAAEGSVNTVANAEGETVGRSTFASMATNSENGNAPVAAPVVPTRRPNMVAGSDSGFNPREFRKTLTGNMGLLKMDSSFTGRSLNDGFSGGEKKRAEILQMMMLKPEIAILDEPDSGLDIDAIRDVSAGVNAMVGPSFGLLIITHYQRILNYIPPTRVHIMLHGKIVESGGPELVAELERSGYDAIRARYTEADVDEATYQDRTEAAPTAASTVPAA